MAKYITCYTCDKLGGTLIKDDKGYRHKFCLPKSKGSSLTDEERVRMIGLITPRRSR